MFSVFLVAGNRLV